MSESNLLQVSKSFGKTKCNTARLTPVSSFPGDKSVCLSARQSQQNTIMMNAKLKRNSLQNTEPSSLTSLDETINLNVADPSIRHKQAKTPHKREYFPKILVTSSMGSTKTVLNTSISTLNTLKDTSTDTKTTFERVQTLNFDDEDDDDDVFLDLPDQIMMTSTSKDSQNLTSFSTPQSFSQGIQNIMTDYGHISEGLETINRRSHRGARRYVKSMQFLNEQLNDPPKKFDFWKENPEFVQKRAKAKQELTKFRAKVEEEKIIKNTLKNIQPDFMPDPWTEEDEDAQFNNIEKIVLKKPRPTPKKRLVSREAQINQRHSLVDKLLKEGNISEKQDRKTQKRMSLNFTPGLGRLTPEQTLFDVLKATNSSKPKLIGNHLLLGNNNLPSSASKSTRRVSAYLQTEPFEIQEEDSSFSSSPKTPQFKSLTTLPSDSLKVKNKRVFFEKSQKEVCKRFCKPIPIEEQKLKPFEHNYDFNQYTKVSISKRSEQITKLRENKQ